MHEKHLQYTRCDLYLCLSCKITNYFLKYVKLLFKAATVPNILFLCIFGIFVSQMVCEIVSNIIFCSKPPRFPPKGILNGIPQERHAQSITEKCLCSHCG